MKKWEAAEMTALSINETEHKWLGVYRDGGYIGDGIVSGHLSCTDPDKKPSESTDPVESLS